MGAGFSKFIQALVAPLMTVFMAVLETVVPTIVSILGLIVSTILLVLLEPLKLILIQLIEAGLLYPFIAAALIAAKFIATLVGRLGAVPVVVARFVAWLSVLASANMSGAYTALYKSLLANEKDPRAYYLNPYYFDTIYKTYPSFEACIAAGRRPEHDLFMNDDIPLLFGVFKPVRDPNFKVTDGITCEYVGDKSPAYSPYIKMFRDFMKSRYKSMMSKGIKTNEVKRAAKDLYDSDDATPLPSRFSENWEALSDHMVMNVRVVTDSAYLADKYVGFDFTKITHLMGFGDLGAQAYIRDAVAPYMSASCAVPSITNVSASNIASEGVPMDVDLTGTTPTLGFLDRMVTDGALSIMEKVAVCTTITMAVMYVHYRTLATKNLLEIY